MQTTHFITLTDKKIEIFSVGRQISSLKQRKQFAVQVFIEAELFYVFYHKMPKRFLKVV